MGIKSLAAEGLSIITSTRGGTIKNFDLRRRRADIKILNRFSGFDRHFKYYGILKCKMRITVSVIKVLNTIHLCIICL